MSLGWAGLVAELAHALCAPFHMFPCPQKVRKGNCERGCKGEFIPKKSSLSGWRGVPSHKYTRVHNNFKSEDLILERKVHSFKLSYRNRYAYGKIEPGEIHCYFLRFISIDAKIFGNHLREYLV